MVILSIPLHAQSTKYTAQQVLNSVYIDEVGNPPAFNTQYSMQNVLNAVYNDTNALRIKITDLPGDNLGNHIATQTLNMATYGISNAGAIDAASYNAVGLTGYAQDGYTILRSSAALSGIFIGIDAGLVNTGGDNVFLGAYAGRLNTTGGDNVFLGNQSGSSNTTGGFNSFLGDHVGRNNTTGSNNTFLGNYAGYSNNTGSQNSFIANFAGQSNTTGDYNAFQGNYAGNSNTIGSGNSFLGAYAGRFNTTGDYNSFLGDQAGYNNTIGSYNSFLGYQAGYSVTTGTNNIVIGYNKSTSAPGANYELNIGGVIFGNLATGAIGIGTSFPATKLHISSGTITIDGTGAPATGGALCLNAAKQMSKCTSALDASGNCTCP